jgi:hypothetical protein
MKKLTLLLTLCAFPFFSQAQMQTQTAPFPKNEVKANILNAIIIGSVEVGYERFFGFHQSIGAKLFFNDRINYHSQSDSQDFSTGGIQIGYNYYFGKENPGSGLYANPFIKYRWGNFTEDKTRDGEPVQLETDMSSFMIGIGGGYKWNFSNSFTIGPFATIARNFSNEVEERFSNIEFTAGISIGYRF